jgi:hypothetical protein
MIRNARITLFAVRGERFGLSLPDGVLSAEVLRGYE